MNVLLTIGHETFMLPGTTGVENMMRVMAKAVKVYDHTWDKDDMRIEVYDEPVRVEMKFVPPGAKFVREKSQEPIEVYTDGPGVKRRALPGLRLLKG